MSSPMIGARSIRNVTLLASCQALAQTQMVLIFTVSAIVAASLATHSPFATGLLAIVAAPFGGEPPHNSVLATLPISLQFLAMMGSTVPAALLMKRIGRVRGFITFIGFGTFGAVLALYAMFEQNFFLFCVGHALFGAAAGSNQQFRFAAIEVAPPAFKNKAISLVLAGGVVAGTVGPTLSTISQEMLLPIVFGGVFAIVIAMQLAMMVLLALTEIPPPTDEEVHGTARPFGEIARQPMFIVALLSAMLGYGVMNFVMLATPLVVTDNPSHTLADSNNVIMWHVVGMFAPSFITGMLITRFGALNIITAGVLASGLCVAINLSGETLWHFRLSMALVGVGWNFMFIGGTALLTETYTPAEKAKTQGINDFFVFGTVAFASLVAGGTYQMVGWTAVNLAVVPALAIVFIGSLWLRTLRQPMPAE